MSSKLPPYTLIGISALATAALAGIFTARQTPQLSIAFIAIASCGFSAMLLLSNLWLLGKVRDYPWNTFSRFASVALIGYLVRTGLIGYAFVQSPVSGSSKLLFVGALALYASEVPVLIGATVAKADYDGATQPAAQLQRLDPPGSTS